MAFPGYAEMLYTEQQTGENTDCSFEFEVKSESGESTKKLIHGHKIILSGVSEYFKNNLKPEWEKNQPIPVKNIEYSIFDKLITAIYLAEITFKDLEEACKLYEAAHFYCIEKTLRILRQEIIEHLTSKRILKMSSLVNLSFKFGDEKLKYFVSKVFAHNAESLLKDPDYLNYSIFAINNFYQLDNLKADECDLLEGLEKYIEETKVEKAKIQAAIDSIRFLTLTDDKINTTSLLSNIEKKLLKTNILFGVSRNKEPRKHKFFLQLSAATQTELRKKFSSTYCWFCGQNHNVHSCNTAKQNYGTTYTLYSKTADGLYNVKANVKILANVEDYSTEDIKKILTLLKGGPANYFQYFNNMDIDKEIDTIYNF